MAAIVAPDREAALSMAKDDKRVIQQYGRMHTLWDNENQPRKVIWRAMVGWID